MYKLNVELNSAANAQHFIRLMKELWYVKSVIPENEEYDWLNPSRPATDEECEQMIAECEAEYEKGLAMPIEEAKEKTLKEIKEWRKRKSQ